MKSLGVYFALQGVTTNVSTLRLQKWPYPRLDVYHRNGNRVNQLQKRPHERSHICYRNGCPEAYWELTSICLSNRKCQSNIATPVVTASIISLQKARDSLKYWHRSWFQTSSKTMTVPVCKVPVKMQSDAFLYCKWNWHVVKARLYL